MTSSDIDNQYVCGYKIFFLIVQLLIIVEADHFTI